MPATGLVVSSSGSTLFLEGTAGRVVIESVADVASVVEACFSARARRLLLHSTNVTPRFFDLSSGEAGEVLQKFRTYRIRAAMLCASDLRASHLFAQFAVGQNQDRYVRFFEEADRRSAIEWLCAEAFDAH
jgi:hypothetical protein